MQEYIITIIDSYGNEHSGISVKITDHVDWQDVVSDITENAIEWCSDNGFSYNSWEF